MAREKKIAKVSTFNLKSEIVELLEQFCNDTGLSKTAAVERFIKEGIEGNQKKQNDYVKAKNET